MEQEICECGMPVTGLTKESLKSNMYNHKRGKNHKRLMKIKKELSKKI